MSRLSQVRDEIVDLRRAGWTLQEIGDRFGCTREAIRLVCKDAGVSRGGWRLSAYQHLAYAVKVAARHELRKQRGGSLSEHGSRARYMSGCRCDECTRVQREAQRALAGQKPPRHGTVSGYKNYGCRCDRCKEAGSYQNRLNRSQRRVKEALTLNLS